MGLKNVLANPRLLIIYVRDKFMPWLPLITYLPQVGWWLCWKDLMGRTVYLDRGFEKSEQAFLLNFLRPGMTAFDIGAHHGFHTLLLSRRVGSHGLVIAFEPSPREMRKLRWTLKINRRNNVRVESYAMGNHEGNEQLFVCTSPHSGYNSLRQPALSGPFKTIKVPVTTLDNYLINHEIHQVDMIKIDAEGAELEILEGAKGLLNSGTRPVIMCEMADKRTLPWGYPAKEIYNLLQDFDYVWFSITPEGKLNPYSLKQDYDENFVAIPQERLKSMEMLLAKVSD